MRCWLESFPCHIFYNVWIGIFNFSITFLTDSLIRVINTYLLSDLNNFLYFSSSFISLSFIEDIYVGVRGVSDGPFFYPNPYGTTIGTTSSSSLFNYHSLLGSFSGGLIYPLESKPSSLIIPSKIMFNFSPYFIVVQFLILKILLWALLGAHQDQLLYIYYQWCMDYQ